MANPLEGPRRISQFKRVAGQQDVEGNVIRLAHDARRPGSRSSEAVKRAIRIGLARFHIEVGQPEKPPTIHEVRKVGEEVLSAQAPKKEGSKPALKAHRAISEGLDDIRRY
jgi:hypothetical protein